MLDMSRPAGSHPARCAVAGHARPVRICRAAAVPEARAHDNESWTIHRINGDSLLQQPVSHRAFFLSFRHVSSISVR